MLEVQDISTFYGNIQALKGVSLHVDQGEIVTLIGSNGAGKTTTLQTISGLLKPRTGTIHLNGQVISDKPAHVVAGMGVAQAPEGRRIFNRMTVMENLELGAYSHGKPDPADLDARLRRSSRGSRSESARRPARCPAASSRCWPSAAR